LKLKLSGKSKRIPKDKIRNGVDCGEKNSKYIQFFKPLQSYWLNSFFRLRTVTVAWTLVHHSNSHHNKVIQRSESQVRFLIHVSAFGKILHDLPDLISTLSSNAPQASAEGKQIAPSRGDDRIICF
jgi:hypothetical protein